MALIDKIQSAKEKVKRKTKAKKADKRAKQRRLENRDPSGVFETAQVAGKESKELGQAVKEFGGQVTPDSTGKAGDVLGDIGEGGDRVVQDLESGNLDPFESGMDNEDGGEMFPFDEGGSSLDDDLDMDLDGY